MTTAELFSAAGEALYGPLWRSEIGRALGVNERQIRRWANGEYDPPAGVWAELGSMCDARRQTLADLSALIPPK